MKFSVSQIFEEDRGFMFIVAVDLGKEGRNYNPQSGIEKTNRQSFDTIK